jgi:hypothetical protein
MKKIVILLTLFSVGMSLFAITVGQYTKTFTDPARSNRSVPSVIYYPIDSSNPGAKYPYIIFGHGWNSNYAASITLTNELVTMGWIVAYPRTEEGILPNTSQFSLDIAFLQGAVFTENSYAPSVLYNTIFPLPVAMGYSMGGACAVVAASVNTNFVSLITYCAAPEIVSGAIAAASSVHVPSLTYSGSTDSVAPPSTNQVPIYNNLASLYKSFISINGVGHTGYYNNSLIPVTVDPFLDYLRTGLYSNIITFEAALASHSSSITYQIVNNLVPSIPASVLLNIENGNVKISWNISSNASNYKIYASDKPNTGFTDITGQGSFLTDSKVHWTMNGSLNRVKFFYITSTR